MITALATASVEGAVLVTLVWLLARLLRVPPATRTVLWWCAAAKFVIALLWTAPVEIPVLPAHPPIVAAVHRVPAQMIADDNAPAATSRSAGRAAPGPSLATWGANGLREWSSFAAIGWTLGLTAAVLVGLRRWHATTRMLREATPAPAVVQAHAADLATRLGMRRVPEVRVSRSAETPLVTGLLRPVVLLPAARFDTLSDEQRRMVICHELAHLKRADLWLGCIPALAERMFFFHPLAHLASREYALAREAACDASAMRTLDAAPQDYGRLLLALGVSPSRPGLTAAGAAWSFQNLKRRISMLQDISVRSTRSRLLTAAIVGLAVAALAPLRLVARPVPAQTTPPTAPSGRVDGRRDLADAQAQNDQQTKKSERRRDASRGLRFVLLSEDGSRTTSGALESGDGERAERQRRNGKALLWFRDGDKEYVIRDPDVLREARAVWTNVRLPDFDADAVRELTQSLESLKVEDLAQQGALMAQSLADSAILTDQTQLIAEQGVQAAEVGLMAAEQALHALSESGLTMSHLDETKLDQHLHSIDTSTLERHFHALEKSADHLEEQIEHSMRELEHNLKGDLGERMKDLHHDLRELDFKELSQLSELGRSVNEAARQATEEMRALIERAIKNGQARPVR